MGMGWRWHQARERHWYPQWDRDWDGDRTGSFPGACPQPVLVLGLFLPRCSNLPFPSLSNLGFVPGQDTAPDAHESSSTRP